MINIILPKNFNECEKYAADELQNFIFQAMKINCLISDLPMPDAANIHLGKTDQWSKKCFEPLLASLGKDGFIIKSDGQEAFIFGSRDRATLYGVYDFLEKFLDIKFIAYDCIIVPQKDNFKLPVADIKSVPDIPLRSYRTFQLFDPVFAARKRMVVIFGNEEKKYGQGLKRDFVDVGHNTLDMVPPQKYLKDHPELYYIKDGKPVDLCWANGVTDEGYIDDKPISTAKILASEIISLAKEHPEAKYFMIAQEDTLGDFCTCENCQKRSKKYGSYSANLVLCNSAVAREVQKWGDANGRKLNIVTFGYNFTEKPPVLKNEDGSLFIADNKIKAADNFYIKITMSGADYAHSFTNKKQRGNYLHDFSYKEVFEGWQLITNNIMIYEYSTNFYEYFWYFPNLRVMPENYKFYKSLNAAYVECQAEFNNISGFQPDLKGYIASKLLWNVNTDVQATIEEFCKYYYESAAGSVLEFIKLFEDHITYLDKTVENFSMHMFLEDWGRELQPQLYPKEVLLKGEKILQDAIDKILESNYANKETIANRIKKVIVTPQRMMLKHFDYYFPGEDVRVLGRKLAKNCTDSKVEFMADGGAITYLDKTNEYYGGAVKDILV